MGYTGGTSVNPTYRNLGDHTETVDMDYDASQTTYAELLDMFWTGHDPTGKKGRQYMSAIFYHDEEQKKLAEQTMKQEKAKRSRPITTLILPAKTFYEAEDYHQKYILQSRYAWILQTLDVDPDNLTRSHVATRLNGYVGGYGPLERFEAEREKLGLDDKVSDFVRRCITQNQGRAKVGC